MSSSEDQQCDVGPPQVMSLSEDHHKAIAAAIPAGVEVSPEFWPKLGAAIYVFCALKEHRTRRPSALSERKRYSRIKKLVDKLAGELRVIRRRPSTAAWPNITLQVLWGVKHIAEAGIIANKTRGAVKGRRDPYREHLYADILNLWVRQLKQPLSYSRARDGRPSGPLIRFIKACVDPVLDNPSAYSVASVIDREKKRRDRAQSKK
jgi:hypothetical protein